VSYGDRVAGEIDNHPRVDGHTAGENRLADVALSTHARAKGIFRRLRRATFPNPRDGLRAASQSFSMQCELRQEEFDAKVEVV
jgi:hypothetical protein